MNKATLIEKIAELVREHKIMEISDLRDESDRSGMRVVIELKRDTIPKVVLNKLYKHTAMQTTFGINNLALVDGVPRTMSIREMLRCYIAHQREVIVRRTRFELDKAQKRAHILEGLLTALNNLDAVVKLIRASKDAEEARNGLIKKFELTPIQAQAILDLRLQKLTGLERDKIKEEHKDLMERIAWLKGILADESEVYRLIKEELLEIKRMYNDERRTQIAPGEDELDIEDLIAEEDMVISITHTGYIKSLPLNTYRKQRRGGVGVIGMDVKEEDFLEHLFITTTHHFLLFFTSVGKVYRLKVHEIPLGSRTSKGRAVVNLLPLRSGERIKAVVATKDYKDAKYLVMATRNGLVKKTEFEAYNTVLKADGIIAIKIRDDDELIAVRHSNGDDDILLVSEGGQAIRFNESRRAADGPRHQRRQGHEPGQGRQGALHERGPRRRRPVRGHRRRLRQAHAHQRISASQPRRQGRQDHQAHRGQGHADRRQGRARQPRAGAHLRGRHHHPHTGQGHLLHGPLHPGRADHEPAQGRPGQRRGARGRQPVGSGRRGDETNDTTRKVSRG